MSKLEKAVVDSVIDIVTFALGLRPLLTEHDLRKMVERRLSRLSNG